jgi:urease accessory protein UreF
MKPVQIQAQNLRAAPPAPAPFLGEPGPLLAHIGAFEPFSPPLELDPRFCLDKIAGPAELEAFLCAYAEEALKAVEFPLIARAYACAVRNQARELIELDRQAATLLEPSIFAAASREIGRKRLIMLRPLRDQRVARRYLEALDTGNAQGWHPLVFGLFMAIYSLPPRQGLLRYGELALTSLADSIGQAKHFPSASSNAAAAALATLPEGIEKAVALI